MSNELVDFAKGEKMELMLFKVSFSQAYDCVNWDFLIYMLKRVWCGPRWM